MLERGQPLLQLHMQAHRADDGPHRARARAPLLDRLDRGFFQLRMVRQAQIVVAGQVDDVRLAVDRDPRPRKARPSWHGVLYRC